MMDDKNMIHFDINIVLRHVVFQFIFSNIIKQSYEYCESYVFVD